MVPPTMTEAPGMGHAPSRATPDDAATASLLAATLVIALERALQTATRLLAALGPLDGCYHQMAQPPPRVPAGGLSRRELGVLRLLAAGHSNRRIAAALCLSPRTVQRHIANAYLKIGTHCRAEAVAYAIRHGLA